MTLRQYLALMTVGTLLAWGAVALIVTTSDPIQAQTAVFVAFYASVLLALTGTFSITGLLMRIGLRQQVVVSRHVAISFRHGVLLAMLFTFALYLQSLKRLTWWNAVLLAAAMTALEFVLISARFRTESHRSA